MGHTGVHGGVDGGVAPAEADNGINGKADGIVRQRRTSIVGHRSVGGQSWVAVLAAIATARDVTAATRG